MSGFFVKIRVTMLSQLSQIGPPHNDGLQYSMQVSTHMWLETRGSYSHQMLWPRNLGVTKGVTCDICRDISVLYMIR